MEFKKENISFTEKKPFVDDRKRFVSKEAGRFKKETEDAAISKIDGSIEKAIRFSSEKQMSKNTVRSYRKFKKKRKRLQKQLIHPSLSIHPGINL